MRPVLLIVCWILAAVPAHARDAGIDWQAWGPGVFAAARAQGRRVMVDAGIEGCTACR
ncbi:MAG: hypothetical protein ACI9WU_000944 [Myxococcota bacterium]|jgi:uncharacterized protein YyaL (SSP411 family)